VNGKGMKEDRNIRKERKGKQKGRENGHCEQHL
jgi:hypothetical protein